MNTARKIIKILGIGLNSTNLTSLLTSLEQKIDKRGKFYIVTPNPEIIMLAQDDPEFYRILNLADFSVPDGVGLVWAYRFFYNPQPTNYNLCRIPGVDLMEKLIVLSIKRGWRVFLLGGQPGVAEEAALRLSRSFQFDAGPWLDNNGKPINEEERKKNTVVLGHIAAFKPHLLFVGFGAPKQEKWIASNYNKIQANGIMAVGGAFDYITSRVPRAPKFVREIGFEWLFRLVMEPWRWRRQMALVRFIWKVITEKIPNSKHQITNNI